MSAHAPTSVSLAEIIDEEHRLALVAEKDHGRHHEFAVRGLQLMASDKFAIDKSRYIFAACMVAVWKHVIFAYLSAVRRHWTQFALSFRIMLEYACVALFVLGEPDQAKIKGSEPDGSPIMRDRTKERAYKWLDKHHGEVSARFKTARDGLSRFEAHGGIIGTGAFFDWDRLGGDEFYASFLMKEVSTLLASACGRFLMIVPANILIGVGISVVAFLDYTALIVPKALWTQRCTRN